MKKQPSPNWEQSTAGILDSYRKLFEIVFKIQVQVTALERTLIEVGDPVLQEAYARHCQEVQGELEDSKAIAIHLLEKTAGQLRGDPKWKD